MKTASKCLRFALILILVAQCASVLTCITVAATDSSVEYYGEGNDPVWGYGDVSFHPGGGVGTSDPLQTRDLAPGMHRTTTIRLENRCDKTYEFYLRAEPLEGDAALEREKYFPGKNVDLRLFEAINVVVSFKDGILYEGKLGGVPGAASHGEYGFPLGSIAPSSYVSVEVTVNVPDWLGNDYMDTLCSVDWQFIARYETIVPQPPDLPGGPPDNGSGGTIITDPDEQIIGDIIIVDPDEAPSDETTITDTNVPPAGDLETNESDEQQDSQTSSEEIVLILNPAEKLPQTGGIKTYIASVASALSLLLIILLVLRIIEKKKSKHVA